VGISYSRVARDVAACAACAALVLGVVFGTYVAGGSDSSCYLNAARLFARGAVAIEQPLVRDAPWPHAASTFTPAGFTPSSDPAVLVPICSPGLPLLMALFSRLHVSPFLVVPLLGAAAVWLTFLVGRALQRPLTGAAAAVLLVCSPTFLYQLVQPMSDVPAMAWWLLATVCVIASEKGTRRPWMAGTAAAMALLTRPNLAPLALVIAAYLGWDGARRTESLGRFLAGLLPGVLALAWLQRAMYGSPLTTGYGPVNGLMAAAHIVPNLRRYAGWLVGTHTPFLLLALAAPFVIPRRREALLFAAIAAATLACYLPYQVFDDWWYTRFLLPALPMLIVLSVAATLAMTARWNPRARLSFVAAGLVMLMTVWVSTATARHAFDFAAMEQHYYRAGTAVAAHVTEPAIIVTLKDSGSVHYHAGQPTLSWDTLDAADLDAALAFARTRGYTPYLLLEAEEEPVFRERFRHGSVLGSLDWPPRVQVGRAIRLYDPLDRARFLADGQVRTRYVPESPAPSRNWRRWLGR
jgi:hypothetical protein